MLKRKYAFTASLQSEWTFLGKSGNIDKAFCSVHTFSFEHKGLEGIRKRKKPYVGATH